MVDVHSSRSLLTVHLPNELIEELRILAGEKQLSVDDVVMEACLVITEPFLWERDFEKWRRAHPEMINPVD